MCEFSIQFETITKDNNELSFKILKINPIYMHVSNVFKYVNISRVICLNVVCCENRQFEFKFI